MPKTELKAAPNASQLITNQIAPPLKDLVRAAVALNTSGGKKK